jgi:hypothetical protein
LTTTYQGSCLCGQVRFAITPPTKWCAHCHCTMCRRAHGAAFVTWIGVPEQQFEFIAGRDAVQWFASSPEARRGHCRHCGSPLFFRSARWPGEIHVVRANVPGEIDRRPDQHVHTDTRVDWLDDATGHRTAPAT